MGEEQRRFPRLEEEFPVNFEVVSVTLPRPLVKPKRNGWAKNISGGGMYLVALSLSRAKVKKLQEHSLKLSIEFLLPDFQNKVKALGDVQWTEEMTHWWHIWGRRWALGVRFTYIQPEDKNCILKYVINKQIESHLAKSVA